MNQPTQKQLNYLMSLQGKLGLSTRFVDVKHWLGKNPVGYQLTSAECSRLIDKAKAECERQGKL